MKIFEHKPTREDIIYGSIAMLIIAGFLFWIFYLLLGVQF